MRILTTILLLFFFNCSFAAPIKYYVKVGGNDAANGLSDATAWATITKVNSFSFALGDTIAFKCDDTFYGTILPSRSGVIATPMVYTSYGTGAKPIITGLTTISSWTNLGSNIWEATVPSGLSTLNVVVKSGALIPMGRYPNSGTSNGGYNTYESFVSNTSLTDNTLSGTPNWTGGQCVMRRADWTTIRALITNHVTTTLTISTTATSTAHAGYGYFVENHPSTLDVQNEWYYDPATTKIKMYSVGNPGTIQVSTLTNLVNMFYASEVASRNFVMFNNLSFVGCEGTAIYIKYSDNISINNCSISFAGIDAINYTFSTFVTINNTSITDINNNGIFGNSSLPHNDITITNDTLRRVGINPGMISMTANEGDPSTGILGNATNYLVRGCVIDSIGYNGIALRQNRVNEVIEKNQVSNFCMVKNDGGGIYNGGQRGLSGVAGIYIQNNLVSSSGDATAGTASPNNKHVRGIYLDATSDSVNVLNNTVWDSWGGIYISSARFCVISGNTVFNAGQYLPGLNTYEGAFAEAGGAAGFPLGTRRNRITNNIFFNKTTGDQLNMYFQDVSYNTDSIGVIDSNYYVNTNTNVRLFTNNFDFSPFFTYRSLTQWQTEHPQYDVHSHSTPRTTPALTNANWYNYIKFYANATDEVYQLQFVDSIFQEPDGTLDTNAVNVPRWGSKTLIFVGLTTRPVVTVGGPYTITQPLTGVPVSGTATDDGGSVTIVWSQLFGPSTITFTNPNILNPVANGLNNTGSYGIKMTATGTGGVLDVSSASTTIDVNPAIPPPNTPPVFSPSPIVSQIKTLPTVTTTATAAATDDVGVTRYEWYVVSSPGSMIISNKDIATPTFGWTNSGIYNLRVAAFDISGDSSSTTWQLTVNPAPTTPPVPDAGIDRNIVLPQTAVTLTGSGVDGTNCAINSNTWTLVSNPVGSFPIITDPSNYNSTFTNMLVAGQYRLRLTVTGACGSSVSDDMIINVAPVYVPPTGCNCFPTFTKFEN